MSSLRPLTEMLRQLLDEEGPPGPGRGRGRRFQKAFDLPPGECPRELGLLPDETEPGDDLEPEEEEKKPPIPKHYRKDCSTEAQKANVRYFVHKKGMPVRQAVAASLSALRRACGRSNDFKGSPSKIVGEEGNVANNTFPQTSFGRD